MIERAINRIAVVGAGVIGASWASYFLAQGFQVSVTDPAPGAEKALRDGVERNWLTLERLGLVKEGACRELDFAAGLEAAVDGAQFVQENGPERLDIKASLFRRLDAAVPENILLATSSSGLLVSEIQTACKHPGRVVLGHPFNPPHLIPLVEVGGGKLTSPEAIDAAFDFYTAIGKRAVRIRKEVKGHVANRLQAAIWREAFHLVEAGVASVADIDAVITEGPGLRWALVGPFTTLHLAGGSGGIEHALDHLGPPISDWWAALGDPKLTPELCAAVSEGVHEAVRGRSSGEIMAYRDNLLMQLLTAKRENPPG
ncbi:MAG: 3-hydroxyacyl-CoA dehydrogenase NAD-binding domain-containing protein [Rhodomicrobium sp.]